MAQAARPRILFAPASGAGVGGGHVMRDLTLAMALQERGATCAFAVAESGRKLIERFADADAAWPLFDRSDDPVSLVAAAAAFQAGAVVLDDYGLDAGRVAALRERIPVLVVIDDLADRTYACDLLIDPGLGRDEADYAGRVPQTCRLALGPAYALVRPDVATLAQADAGSHAGEVRRVFVSFGLSDVDGIAARAVRVVRLLAPAVHFDVALASDAESLPALTAMAETDPGLHIHPDAREVAALMRAADVAVGAGGSSTWERCALGQPTLAAIVADNQREMIRNLAGAGVLLAADTADAGFDKRFAAAFGELLRPEVRLRLSAASRALCDGQGAGRAADAILALI